MRCDQCQFWEKPRQDDEWDAVASKAGRCSRTPHRETSIGWSEDDELRNEIRPEFSDRTAFACDTSGYYAWLLTTADHFCAMFQQAEEPKC